MKQEKIRLIALDMDGTLLNNQGEISEVNWQVLKKTTEAGVAVAVATGRAYTELPVEMLCDAGIRYAITGNGSAVYRMPEKECIYSDCLDTQVLCEILRKLEVSSVYYDIYIEGLVYCQKSVCQYIEEMDMPQALQEHICRTRILVDDLAEFVQECGKQVEKVTINFAYRNGVYEGRAETARMLDGYPQVHHLCGGYHNLEFTKTGVTKGSGLRFLAEQIGVPMNATMACGDSENDLSMLEAAQLAIAMENASEEVKEAADAVTASNEDNGVAAAIEKYVLR